MPTLPELRLKVRVHGRHPWFLRGMVQRPARPIAAGSAVRVVDRGGARVGVGFYNPRTELALRMLGPDQDRSPDDQLLERLDAAIDLREQVLDLPRVTDGYRVAHAEGDGLPGLILDRLGDAIVAQVFALCAKQRIEAIGARLLERRPEAKLVLTVDPLARKREGIDPAPPPPRVETLVVEHGVRYRVTAGHGHKTGFFADQRDNRQRVRALARGRRVLDLFCNSGGFAIQAALGGAAEVVAADLDEEVLETARGNGADNGVEVTWNHADAFDELRQMRPGRFDLIVLDPPKWAASKAELDAACARYSDLNRTALERAAPGALIATFSCSGSLSDIRFRAILRDAAVDARRDVRILFAGGAGADHPIALECPETGYLKAFLLQVRR